MAHLAQITRETRISLKVGSVLLVVFLLLFFSFKGYGFFKSIFFPAPPPPPEQGFGQIAQTQFPQSDALIPTTYTVNTIDGSLPTNFPDRMPVFVLSTPSASLLALQNAKVRVADFGFTTPEIKRSDSTYQWVNNEKGLSLTYDIVTKNFKLDSNPTNKIGPNNDELQKDEEIKKVVSEYLATFGINTDDIDQERTEIILLRNDGQQFVKTDKKSEAQLARVNLYQKKLPGDKALNIFYPYPDKTIMTFLVAQPDRELEVVQAEFIHKIVTPGNRSDYPIKTPQQAFEDLQQGNALIVSNPSSQQAADITEVELGYYLGPDIGTNELGQVQKHVQPIYIFRGGNNFLAFVPAVSPSAISTQ